MPGFFPAAVDDELLYSLVARYGAIAGLRSGPSMIKDVFGTSVGIAAVDLPRGLDRLIARLPHGHGLDVDGVIAAHTLFPYLLRYAPAETAATVRAGMAGQGMRRPAHLGVLAASVPARQRLVVCRACAKEDAKESGIASWRRVHQLPGVLVCPRHGGPLAETSAERIHRMGRAALAAADAATLAGAVELEVPRGGRAALLKVARQSLRLLGGELGGIAPDDLQARLRGLLTDFRWARAPSLMDMSALVEAFRRHRPVRQVMEAAGAVLADGPMATALNRLLYREQAAKHPLLVLMVLEIAGASLDDLASAAGTEDGALYSGYRPARTAAPVRPGPASDEVDAIVAAILADPAISVRAVGRATGLGGVAVMRRARKLGIWRDGWKDRPKLRPRQEKAAARLLARHRDAWAVFRTAHPEVSAKQMPKAPFNAYRYLLRHDRAWLAENHPLLRTNSGGALDWRARDRELAAKATCFLSDRAGRLSPGPPSRSQIGRGIGAYSAVMARLDRLPELATVIEAAAPPSPRTDPGACGIGRSQVASLSARKPVNATKGWEPP